MVRQRTTHRKTNGINLFGSSGAKLSRGVQQPSKPVCAVSLGATATNGPGEGWGLPLRPGHQRTDLLADYKHRVAGERGGKPSAAGSQNRSRISATGIGHRLWR